ncbi:MAG: hypothetical protein AAFU64_15735 [Bacteroidota bacterium]
MKIKLIHWIAWIFLLTHCAPSETQKQGEKPLSGNDKDEPIMPAFPEGEIVYLLDTFDFEQGDWQMILFPVIPILPEMGDKDFISQDSLKAAIAANAYFQKRYGADFYPCRMSNDAHLMLKMQAELKAAYQPIFKTTAPFWLKIVKGEELVHTFQIFPELGGFQDARGYFQSTEPALFKEFLNQFEEINCDGDYFESIK